MVLHQRLQVCFQNFDYFLVCYCFSMHFSFFSFCFSLYFCFMLFSFFFSLFDSKTITEFSRLRELDLSFTKISDQTVESLASSNSGLSLLKLNLNATSITIKSISACAGILFCFFFLNKETNTRT